MKREVTNWAERQCHLCSPFRKVLVIFIIASTASAISFSLNNNQASPRVQSLLQLREAFKESWQWMQEYTVIDDIYENKRIIINTINFLHQSVVEYGLTKQRGLTFNEPSHAHEMQELRDNLFYLYSDFFEVLPLFNKKEFNRSQAENAFVQKNIKNSQSLSEYLSESGKKNIELEPSKMTGEIYKNLIICMLRYIL